MVGAAAGDLERARPILEAMGNKIIHCGPQGSGISMKIVNNFLAMATCQLSAEALTLGSQARASDGDDVRGDHELAGEQRPSQDLLADQGAQGRRRARLCGRSCLQGPLDRGERGGAGRGAGPDRRGGAGLPWPRRAPATGSAARTSPPSCSRQPRMPASSRRGFRIPRSKPRRRHPLTAPAASPSTT